MAPFAASRSYTRAEVVADAAIHAAGLAFALIAGPMLVVFAAMRGDGWMVLSVSVYAATLLAMVALSATYNLLGAVRPAWSELLRRLDHGAIYLKIAGTYTPFAAMTLSAPVGRPLLIGVWTVAAIGFLTKLIAPRRVEFASVAIYLALGWAGVWVAGEMARTITPGALVLLGVGGGLYTLGVAFHLWQRLPFQNAIWHLFVLAATACMYAAIALDVVARG